MAEPEGQKFSFGRSRGEQERSWSKLSVGGVVVGYLPPAPLPTLPQLVPLGPILSSQTTRPNSPWGYFILLLTGLGFHSDYSLTNSEKHNDALLGRQVKSKTAIRKCQVYT